MVREERDVRVLFVGPPGAGKGTQSVLLSQKMGLLHVAPGDIFRQEVRDGTELGKLVKSYMDQGALVPDDVTVEVVKKRLLSPAATPGFVLDGFPRNLSQARALDEILGVKGLDVVLNLDVPFEELVARSASRRVCPSCGKPYNLRTDPPKVAGKCDVCGAGLIMRDDDRPETVRERLRVYNESTMPLIDYYRARGLLEDVNGLGERDEVFERVMEKIRHRLGDEQGS
jgi:adenylate kinase